ncbi:hypothetical protein [Bradyrhizobium sp. Tv2a-2]|uniref:hypothetical protein n=1 Tax=Bradyrhizobium sp. Tv2a-2 TaxID=113395 RepID=UPI001FDAC94E|nr:hypothetical protein [Bradyrhizobium sp. Tv2a-2]
MTYEIPLQLSDTLWDVLVVQFAAWLDRLTLRRIIAFIPVLVLVLAYAHSIPIPPELMLIGDVLAYIDIFSVILLLGLLSRAATIIFVMKQTIGHATELAKYMLGRLPRLDFRHRRETGGRDRKRLSGHTRDDDECAIACSLAWA